MNPFSKDWCRRGRHRAGSLILAALLVFLTGAGGASLSAAGATVKTAGSASSASVSAGAAATDEENGTSISAAGATVKTSGSASSASVSAGAAATDEENDASVSPAGTTVNIAGSASSASASAGAAAIDEENGTSISAAAAVVNANAANSASASADTVFVDVSTNAWYAAAVQEVTSSGYFRGTSETEFGPDETMTRGMFVTVLGRVANADTTEYSTGTFADVADDAYYSGYVAWASSSRIVSGTGGGQFSPDGSVTREQMAAILYRYAVYAGVQGGITDEGSASTAFDSYPDADQVSDYATEAFAWACRNGILNGSDGMLLPQNTATRAQVAQIITNYKNRFMKNEDEDPSDEGGPQDIMLSFTGDTTTQQTVTWHSDMEVTEGRVFCAEKESLLQEQRASGSLEPVSDSILTADGAVVTIHSGVTMDFLIYSATLTGLTPGTEYFYCVADVSAGADGSPQKPVYSKVSTLRTAEDGQSSFSFMYLGDIQFSGSMEEEYKDWARLVEETYQRNPDLAFALQGGDIVQNGIRTAQWESFLSNATGLFSRIAFMPANGNHESNYKTGKPEVYKEMFSLPKNGPEGFEEEFYSFEYGNAHITILNSWVFSGEQTLSEEQYQAINQWIREDFNNSSALWKIAVMHHPVYPLASDTVSDQVREQWEPIFRDCGVKLVFCGHQHVTTRSYPMRDGGVDYENGVTYIMGNSGQKFYSTADETWQEKAIYNTSTAQVVRINGSQLEVFTYDRNGQELDYCSILPPSVKAEQAD